MKKDIEYLLVSTENTEDVIFSSNKLKDIADFCRVKYDYVRFCRSKDITFMFEGIRVRIEEIDLNAEYEV